MKHWSRIEKLFPRLVDASAHERSSLLASLAESDRTLHEELVSLLRGHDAVGVLDSPPAFVDEAAEIPLLEAESMLGSWRILGLIGRGGSGDVYSAMRADGAFEQRVAVKVLRRNEAQDAERFRIERQILARLDHPGIARILDGGVCADGRLYTVMEFVEGEALDCYCNARGLGLRGRLELFLQVCDAAAYAHQNLVVHRDLKPANILVNATGHVRLVDFGIARLLAGEEIAGKEAAVSMFTPEYAAPEQIAGEAVTTATDVYALGVVLFELMTGARPPRSGATIAPSRVAGTMQSAPVAAGRLRGDLDAIVLKCLQPLPPDRYGTLAALKRDIELHLNGEPVQARPLGPARRVLKLMARRKLLSAVTTAAILAIVAAGGVAAWQARIAADERDNAQALADRNRAVNEFMSVVITSAPRAGRPVTAAQLLDRSQ
ncbi:MAG: serine/threonine-protein kinase [Steroidobacteraceae bacterium]